jgi:PiT family inorganic phosphate transporter
MPSSSSHAIIGGLVGAGLAAAGLAAINWKAVSEATVAIVASPLVAFTIAYVAMFLVAVWQRLSRWHDNARPFKVLQLFSAAAVSFGHGANDAQKTMGLIAALLVGSGHAHAGPGGKIPIAPWIPIVAYGSIALGTIWGGWKIIETMGLKITTLHANSGLAANIGAITAIFGATGLGIPVSTTHAAASSVTGSGIRSGGGVNLKVVGEMMTAWLVTVPATMGISWIMYRLTQLPGIAAWPAVGSVLLALGGGIAYAMTHTITAEDVEAEIPPELELAKPLKARPHLDGEEREAA